MLHRTKKGGFTLLEMLIVIAIIAILISVAVPYINPLIVKAQAATDAANLRTVLAEANILTFDQNSEAAFRRLRDEPLHSKVFPNAVLKVYYNYPVFWDFYFVEDGNAYGLDYFAELAEKGDTSIQPKRFINPDSLITIGGED